MNTKTLLVIDMQKDLCHNLRRKNKVANMLPPLLQAIDLFSSAKMPIFYIRFSLKKDDEQFDRFGDKYCIEGTEGAELIPELFPLRGPVITKQKHSAFYETNLHDLLTEAGVHEVYLAGLQTHICIMTTAADASFRGYKAIAIKDCVLSTTEANKEDALFWIKKYVGDVKSLNEVASEISNEAT
ncbi:MAG: cysteine hydrolase [gamma proteobacterium endosymbiont of Lamellibrachia anaximandri]|nr:cysteine hydrolase [gamma proteobacterium endosymbiont of Lamellibrachia anaximandri]MBL3535033.1 cysteine hydrolase [gamma proteobacterium endosymbiont of Lamellibrachia anaximandri]